MPQKIKIKRSNVTTLPSTAQLSAGELGYTEVAGVKRLFIGNYAGTGVAEIGGDNFALLNSPTFTGTPIAPTATSGTNTTQIATTAFVQSAVSGGGSNDKIFQFSLSKTFPIVCIDDGDDYNIFDLINQTDVTNATRINFGSFSQDFSYNNSQNGLIFPAFANYTIYSMRIILNGTLGSSGSTNKQFYLELRRAIDDSVVSSYAVIKVNNLNLSGITNVLLTFTNGLVDPYILNGVRLVINNQTSSDLNLTGFSVLLAGNATNFN